MIWVLALAVMALIVGVVFSFVYKSKFGDELKRGEQHLAELAHMTLLAEHRSLDESKRYWEESRKFWERADQRWSDHELLMRMILERVDKKKE